MDANELSSLAAFRLAWRFSPERSSLSEADANARLRPLTRAAATLVANEARQRSDADGSPAHAFRSDDSPGSVVRELRDLDVTSVSTIIVSWDDDTALETDWACFVSHWDDFCYPASDDVTIWSPDADWTLCYRHYEVFQFRRTGDPVRPVPRAEGKRSE